MIYPKILEELMNYFKKFPGVGEKSAERMALSLLDFSSDELEMFSNDIIEAKKTLHDCQSCGNLTDQDECYICANKIRNHNLICVVEDYKSVFMFEKMGKYNGIYHVLHGLISPIDGIGPDDINLSSLFKKCKEQGEKLEIVIALKPTLEGETTTQYISKKLEKQGINISRLSYGIPVGTEIDYLDVLTLERAFEDRKKLS
jgi:recombination protein RecR